MIVITNRIPLRTLYPKPQEKCGLLMGNLDNGQRPEISSLLYRVSFKVKSDQTGEIYQDLITSNFLFDTVNTKGGFRAGSLVTYQPKNKNDPNYGMIAQVKKVTAPITNIEAVRMGGPRKPDPEKMFFEIEFLAPKEVGGKVIYEKKNLRKSDLKLYHEGDLVYSYECGPDFINYDSTDNVGSNRKLENYYSARNRFRSSQSPANREALRVAENAVWNENFFIDSKNQPTYPDFKIINKEIHTGMMGGRIQTLTDYLNDMVERMVATGFVPNNEENRKKILGKKPNLKARFPVPKGAKRGKKITITIGGKDIVVKIPGSPSIDNNWSTILKPNEIVEAPIDRDDNLSIYEQLSSKVKDTGSLEFIPTVIKAEFAKGKDVKVLDMEKMIPPPKDQQFFIKNAKIKKVDGKNWKFKELDSFDKEMEQLIIDLEVLVDLELGVKTKYADGEKPGMFGRFKDMIGDSLLSSSACSSRMEDLRDAAGALIDKATPPMSLLESAESERNRQEDIEATKRGRLNHMRSNEETLIPGVRRVTSLAGGGRRNKKTRKKNYKKKRRTMRLNYIKGDYRKSRKRNRKKRTKRRR